MQRVVSKIALTGATGFVGRYVLRELAAHGYDVVATVRDEHASLPSLDGVRWVHWDIARAVDDPFGMLGQPDVLIHLAWAGLPNYRSLHHFQVELPRHFDFLGRLIDQGLHSLLIAGTCFEYGMQSGSLSEVVQPDPRNAYGFAKYALYRQLRFLQETKSFNLTWARLFYLFGEGQSSNSLWAQLRSAVHRGARRFDMSQGDQLRDYLPVAVAARMIVCLSGLQQNIDVVNICSGRPISVRRLVEAWVRDNNWTIELNLGHFPYPGYEPMAFWGDNRKFMEIAGELDLEVGNAD